MSTTKEKDKVIEILAAKILELEEDLELKNLVISNLQRKWDELVQAVGELV